MAGDKLRICTTVGTNKVLQALFRESMAKAAI
jgi:hypothetical protein